MEARGDGPRVFDRVRLAAAASAGKSTLPTWRRKLKKLRETALEIIYYSLVSRRVPPPSLFTTSLAVAPLVPRLPFKVRWASIRRLEV